MKAKLLKKIRRKYQVWVDGEKKLYINPISREDLYMFSTPRGFFNKLSVLLNMNLADLCEKKGLRYIQNYCKRDPSILKKGGSDGVGSSR